MTALESHITDRLTGTEWTRIQIASERITAAASAGYYLEAAAADRAAQIQRKALTNALREIADHLGLTLVVPSDAAAVSAIGNLSHAMQIADARHAARREAGE